MNYIEKACKELGKTIEKYLIDTKYNFVVIENNHPWLDNDKTPMIYGSQADALNEIAYVVGDKNTTCKIINEWDYLVEYDNNTLDSCLSELIRKYGENDGICTTFFLIEINKAYYYEEKDIWMDVLNIGFGVGNYITILLSDENDDIQYFDSPYILDNEHFYMIVEQLCQCGIEVATESVETKKENTMEETINKIKEISAIADVESQVLKILNNITEKRLEGNDEYCCKEIVEITEKLFKVFEK